MKNTTLEEKQIERERDPDANQFYECNKGLLNESQNSVFKELQLGIDKKGGVYMIDASAGYGKTFLINLLLAYVRKENNIAIATATSGISSTLFKDGTTAHKRFRFPIPHRDFSSCAILLQSQDAKIILESRIIILDEITMLHYNYLDALNRFLKELMESSEIFGGKLLVLSGDFRQILPIVPQGGRPQIVHVCVKSSETWQYCKILHLHTNMRIQNLINLEHNQHRKEELQEFGK